VCGVDVKSTEVNTKKGLKTRHFRDWIKKGKGIPAHKIGKKWKFKYSELDAWVKSGQSAIE
jgi:excisionase family DNA binding protein